MAMGMRGGGGVAAAVRVFPKNKSIARPEVYGASLVTLFKVL
eukprot:COSAG01_NODE_1513_length_10065_cov_63.160144_2_plen_42_part_00